MKVLAPRIHGIIDYASVVALALAPTLLGLQGASMQLAYALAVIHLVLTLLTDFPLGMAKVVPLRLHGWVEIVVGIALLVLPWVVAGTVDLGNVGRIFYCAFGAVLIAVWFLTDYGSATHAA